MRQDRPLGEVIPLAQPAIVDPVAVGVLETFLAAAEGEGLGMGAREPAHRPPEAPGPVEAMQQDQAETEAGRRQGGESEPESQAPAQEGGPEQARDKARSTGHAHPFPAANAPASAAPSFAECREGLATGLTPARARKTACSDSAVRRETKSDVVNRHQAKMIGFIPLDWFEFIHVEAYLQRKRTRWMMLPLELGDYLLFCMQIGPKESRDRKAQAFHRRYARSLRDRDR